MIQKILEWLCFGNGQMEDDPMFQDLRDNPHGPNRWRNVNHLHKKYDISKDSILDLTKH